MRLRWLVPTVAAVSVAALAAAAYSSSPRVAVETKAPPAARSRANFQKKAEGKP